MADENLLATFEQSLRQARATRSRMAARLADLEAEADKVRGEIAEVDALANQTEAAIYRLLTSMISPVAAVSDAEIEAAMRHDAAAAARQMPGAPAHYGHNNGGAAIGNNLASNNYAHQPIAHQPPSAPYQSGPAGNFQPVNDRFLDRTIPQATTVLLRESSGPLHVNEIHKRLIEGGFNFTGHNPTISIAVSLNRNRRFRKVAPGTFDLVMRDAAQQQQAS